MTWITNISFSGWHECRIAGVYQKWGGFRAGVAREHKQSVLASGWCLYTGHSLLTARQENGEGDDAPIPH
jgi:hypothetical protein